MKMKLFGIASCVLALLALGQPAQAACGAPFLIASINPTTSYYASVYNPTVTDQGYMGSSITGAVTGFFWGVGVGDPALGTGADNGGWPTLNWLYIYPAYPAAILTTWAADPSIDTCIDVMGTLGNRCQVTFMQDVDTQTGAGLFALMSTPDDPASGDFFLDNGGVNITLAPMVRPTITASTRTGGGTGVDVTVRGAGEATLVDGLYLDSTSPACTATGGAKGDDPTNGLVTGYHVYYQLLPRDSMPPTDFNRSAWTDSGSATRPVGFVTDVSIDCSAGDSDVYLAWSLVLDSGFESDLLSAASTRIECGPNIAEPDNIRVRPEGRQAPRTRQR